MLQLSSVFVVQNFCLCSRELSCRVRLSPITSSGLTGERSLVAC